MSEHVPLPEKYIIDLYPELIVRLTDLTIASLPMILINARYIVPGALFLYASARSYVRRDVPALLSQMSAILSDSESFDAAIEAFPSTGGTLTGALACRLIQVYRLLNNVWSDCRHSIL